MQWRKKDARSLFGECTAGLSLVEFDREVMYIALTYWVE